MRNNNSVALYLTGEAPKVLLYISHASDTQLTSLTSIVNLKMSEKPPLRGLSRKRVSRLRAKRVALAVRSKPVPSVMRDKAGDPSP